MDVFKDNFKESNSENDILILSEYFDKILELFEKGAFNSAEYEMVFCDSSISFCPQCCYPVIVTSKKVLCMDLCFEFLIPDNLFNNNFTLDNFIDILYNTYTKHINCVKGQINEISLFLFEGKLCFECNKCFSEYIK